jgi:hypothetical protein
MSQLGRISGPLLADNLLRNGSDLAFETSLLYLNVTDRRLGVNTIGPTHDLTVGETTHTSHLIVDSDAFIANLEFSGYQIQNVVGNITISPNQSLNPSVTVPILQTPGLQFTGSAITNVTPSGNVVINSQGGVTVNSNMLVNGSLHATGDITFDGNLQLGNASTETINFAAEVNSDILPSIDNNFSLGSDTDIWANVYVHDLTIHQQVNLNASALDTLIAGNFTFANNNITVVPNSNATIIPTGTGVVNIESSGLTVKIIGNTWTPDPSVNVFQFSSTGVGHWDLSQSPVVFPAGASGDRPADPQVGMIRYNTSDAREEVYNGVSWQPAIGPGGAITKTQVDDIMNIWSLILG